MSPPINFRWKTLNHPVVTKRKSSLVAQPFAYRSGDQEVAGSIPSVSGNVLVEIDHEICSTAILSLPLIKEGHFSVSDERMCTSTG